jgi:hypothetical protein
MSRNYHSKSSYRGDKDYHRGDNDRADNDCQNPSPPPSNDCKPDHQPTPPPVCDPTPPPVCDPSDQPGNDHHAALVSADIDADINVAGLLNVEADVDASLLGGGHLLSLDADVDVGLGLWHA